MQAVTAWLADPKFLKCVNEHDCTRWALAVHKFARRHYLRRRFVGSEGKDG